MAKTGDRNSWDSLINYIVSSDKRVADFYTVIDSLIDIDNFIDYYIAHIFIAHIFIANEDWPGNNIAHWRYKTENQKIFNSKYADGRWRWLFYDADMAADHVHYNSLKMATAVNSQAYQNPAWSTVVLRNLLENNAIRDKFITRFAYLLKNDFHPSNTIPIIKAYRDNIKPYIQIHIARWNNPKDISTWERYNNKLIYFFEKRPTVQIEQLANYFNINKQDLF